MSYYNTKTVNESFSRVRTRIEEALKKQGFGIISEIDMDQKFREKLGIEFRRYKILGACSPKHAYLAVTAEEHIGLMLPCNVVMQEKGTDAVEVSVIDPVASMQAVKNPHLEDIASEIRSKLREFLESL
jgi:uncharacterized protein (DUF302 family)